MRKKPPEGDNDHDKGPPPRPPGKRVKPDGPHSQAMAAREPMSTAMMKPIPKK